MPEQTLTRARLTVADDGRTVLLRGGDVELARYTYRPDTPRLESPKPYLHPVRTPAGRPVTLFRPHDHVWHKGIAWSLPVVGDENFWGGPTYVRGEGYVQRPNNGAQVHREMIRCGVDVDGAVAGIVHALDWVTQDGRTIFTERRTLTARFADPDAWILGFTAEMTNVTSAAIPLGSPTTRGRDNAGYGGLFWRGPRSFTGGTVITPGGRGTGGDVRGRREEWMAFEGRQDEVDATSLVVMVDPARPQWFARSEEFACLNPASFFSEEHAVQPGETVVFRYGVAIADAAGDSAAALAAACGIALSSRSA